MQKNTENTELLKDKASAEQLFSSEALAKYKMQSENTPAGYFEQFETQVLSSLQSTKTRQSIFTLPKWGQLAIAASFFTIVATTFIVIESKQKSASTNYNVSLTDIATTEIDAYVKENEEFAEIDWQEEISKEGRNLESLQLHLKKDTNITQ